MPETKKTLSVALAIMVTLTMQFKDRIQVNLYGVKSG
jgi:hypothetical protein